MDKHPSAQELEAFVAGRLAEADAETIIIHLAECEPCLALVDQLWVGVDDQAVPNLDSERSRHVERRLWRRIHRSNLGGQVIRMGTHGLLSVLLALLRPLFSRR